MRLATILAELRAADAQPGDWYGWLTNQAAHMSVVGAPLALLLLWLGVPDLAVPIMVAAAYGILWEWAIQRGKDMADSLMDTAMVMCGAAFVVGLTVGVADAAIIFLIYAGALSFGVMRRA